MKKILQSILLTLLTLVLVVIVIVVAAVVILRKKGMISWKRKGPGDGPGTPTV